MINVFCYYWVGVYYFFGVIGYGYDDLGWEILDKVFVEVMGVEVVVVRV